MAYGYEIVADKAAERAAHLDFIAERKKIRSEQRYAAKRNRPLIDPDNRFTTVRAIQGLPVGGNGYRDIYGYDF